MRGFKPDVAQKSQAQNFADGGIVLGVKRFLGMDAERNARAAEYRAREAKDKQAAAQQAQAQQKPAQPSAEPARGISGYASGNGLERRMKEVDGYKNGGPVRGPGTGTSDQVPANVPEGTFIMPADSTKAIGEKKLKNIGAPDEAEMPGDPDAASEAAEGKAIPVNLSNGEYKIPPKQVHAVGVQALNKMKDATHTPVQNGNAPAAKPEIFFANGGQVRDPNRPDIPVVGTRGPAQGAGGGGLSAQAIAAAQARQQQPAQQAPKIGIAGLTANPVTNPQGILDERMKRAGFFGGGAVTEEEAARRLQEQSGGRLATGAENVIGAQPAKQQAPVVAAPQAPALHASAPAPMAAPVSRQLDPQAAADRSAIGGAWNSVKGASEDAGRAILDVAALAPRAAAGIYDSAYVRPARAAGFNAGYLSQHLVPDGVDTSSMTPFTDQKRMREQVGPSAAAATAPAGALPSVRTDAQRGGGNVQADVSPVGQRIVMAPQAAPGTSEPPQPLPGIYRKGNSYADSVDGLAGSNTGQPNAQNMAAAQALSDRGVQQSLARGFNPAAPQAGGSVAPIVRNSTNDWASRKALENAATAASSITANGGRFDSRRGTSTGWRNDQQILPPSDKQAAYGAMVGNDMALQQQQSAGEQAAMRENAATGRTATQEAGALNRLVLQQGGENARAGARNALDGRRITAEEGRYALDAKAKDFDIRQAGRMEALQNEYMAAQGDPTKEAAVAKKMQVLNGKSGTGEWGVQVTPPTKNADGSTTEGSIVRYNKSTGQTERVDGGQGAAALPPGMKRQVGTSNGRPVYEDANGKQVIGKGN